MRAPTEGAFLKSRLVYYKHHLAEAAIRLTKKHKPETWGTLCALIHPKTRPWFPEHSEITPERSVLTYLAMRPSLTNPPQIHWSGLVGGVTHSAAKSVDELLGAMYDATQSGEIIIAIGTGTGAVELVPGRLRAKQLSWDAVEFPFDLPADKVKIGKQWHDVVGVTFAAAAPEFNAVAEPTAPTTSDKLKRRLLTTEWLAKYDARVTADHFPTVGEDRLWAKEQNITRSLVERLRAANNDPRRGRSGAPKKLKPL